MAHLILIVEDDADIREDLAAILRDLGYRVVTAANGRDAYEQLRAADAKALHDLILLDLMMPVMDGWHFRAKQLANEALAHIPVVLLSGAGDVQSEALSLATAGYVEKPFKLDALLVVVARSCAAA